MPKPKSDCLWDAYHAEARVGRGGPIVHYFGICEAGKIMERVKQGWTFFKDRGATLVGKPSIAPEDSGLVLAAALRTEHVHTLVGIEEFGFDAVRGAWLAVTNIAPSLKRELERVRSLSPRLDDPDDLDWASFPKLRCHLSSLCFKCRELWLPGTTHVCGAVARERERAKQQEREAKKAAAKEAAAKAKKEAAEAAAKAERREREKAMTAASKARLKASAKAAARAKPRKAQKGKRLRGPKPQSTIDKETANRSARRVREKVARQERMAEVNARRKPEPR